MLPLPFVYDDVKRIQSSNKRRSKDMYVSGYINENGHFVGVKPGGVYHTFIPKCGSYIVFDGHSVVITPYVDHEEYKRIVLTTVGKMSKTNMKLMEELL